MKRLLTSTLALIVVMGAAPALARQPEPPRLASVLAGLSDEITLPSAWLGIWDTQTTLKDCETMVTFFQVAGTDTVCPDEVVLGGTGINYVCDGTAGDTEYHYTCTADYVLTPGCNVHAEIQFDGTRNGNSFNSVGSFNLTYTGDCELTGTYCTRYEIAGTRTSTSTEGCSTPVEPTTWSGIKARY